MRPEPGLRLTIIARGVETPYSGMLPGHVAGVYEAGELHIDVARLARFAGANFIAGEVTGVEPDQNRVLLRGRPPMRYDILSINTGGVPGGGLEPAEWITPVKPIGRFLPRWRAVAERLARETVRLVLIGGGPGSVELALAVRTRFPDTAHCVVGHRRFGHPAGPCIRRPAQTARPAARSGCRCRHRVLRRGR